MRFVITLAFLQFIKYVMLWLFAIYCNNCTTMVCLFCKVLVFGVMKSYCYYD